MQRNTSLELRRDRVKHRLNLSASSSPPGTPTLLSPTGIDVHASPKAGSSVSMSESFDQVPASKEYKFKFFGSTCAKGGTNLNFPLKEGSILPHSTKTITKKGKGKKQTSPEQEIISDILVFEICFSKCLTPTVKGYRGKQEGNLWVFHEGTFSYSISWFDIFIAVANNSADDSRNISTLGEPVSVRSLETVPEEPNLETEGMQKKEAPVRSALTQGCSRVQAFASFPGSGVLDFESPPVHGLASPSEVHGLASPPKLPVVFVSPSGVPDFATFPGVQVNASPSGLPTPTAPLSPLYPEIPGFVSPTASPVFELHHRATDFASPQGAPHFVLPQRTPVIEHQPTKKSTFQGLSSKEKETKDENDWITCCLDKFFCM